MFERTKKTGDTRLITNAENCLKDCQKEKDALEIFKKDLGTVVRFYEFMSQIVDYGETDLDNVVLSHYRVTKLHQQDLKPKQNIGEDLSTAHQNQMLQLLADPKKAAGFARIVFDLLVAGKSNPVM